MSCALIMHYCLFLTCSMVNICILSSWVVISNSYTMSTYICWEFLQLINQRTWSCIQGWGEKENNYEFNKQLNDKNQFKVGSFFLWCLCYAIIMRPLHKHWFTSNIQWVIFPSVLLHCLWCITNHNLFYIFFIFFVCVPNDRYLYVFP